MRHNRLLLIITVTAAMLPGTEALQAQCVNMTDLDDPGTTCSVFNHEFIYKTYTIENYDWKEYPNVIEDYGLSTSNNYSYNVPNVLCTRQTIVTEQGPDYLQPALKMIPEGRATSIRIGNPRNGSKGTPVRQPSQFMSWHPQGEAISMEYKVTAENAIMLFEYAAILDRTHHTTDDNDNELQAHIDISITDKNGNDLNPSSLAFSCRGNRSVASDAAQGWQSFTHSGISSSWKDWSKVGFDLTKYIGQTVRLRVANFDCAVDESQQWGNVFFYYCGKHFSYIYFYVDCARKELEVECLENQQARLTAPEGFIYRWYNKSKPSTTLGTARTVVVPTDGKTTYCCEVTQKERMKGSFVLEATPLCGKEVNLKATVCEKDLPYVFGGKKLTESGRYTNTVTLAAGIDSVTNLDLTVERAKDMPHQTAYFCTGGTYTWKMGKKTRTLTKSGIYRDTIRYASGCDSARYSLELIEKDKIYYEDHQQVCAATLNGGGYGFRWNRKWINSASQDGLTFDTISTLSGCDSIVTLRLDIQEDLESYDTVIVTESEIRKGFMWNGYSVYYDDKSFKSFTEAETYFNNFFTEKSSSKGCKEYTKLRLYIVKEIVEDLSLCETELPVEWRGYTIASAEDNGKVYNDNKNRIRYTLNLAVYPTYDVVAYDTICDGEELTFGDTLLTSTGVYKRTLQSQYGCDSTVTLNLTVQIAKTVRTERITICKGQPAFNWDGHGPEFQNLSQEGFYYDTTYYTTGCPKEFYTLRISVGDSTIAHLDRRICDGDSINFFGDWIKKSGTYRGVTENIMQCDSIIYMHLDVMPPLQVVTIDSVLCDVTSIQWRGQTITKDGQYKDTLVSTLKCDSIAYILNARFMSSSSATINTTLCFGETITVGDTVFATEGTHTRTIANAAGCDSVVTLHITYLPEPQTINAFICEGTSYPFHGKEYSKTGQYYFSLGKTDHCEAIDTLNLTVGTVVSGDEYKTLCDGDTYRFGDLTLSASGDYERLIERSGTGLCDSLARLHLTVLPAAELIERNDTLYEGDTIYWRDTTITTGGDYTQRIQNQLGCDSLVYTLHSAFRGVSVQVIDTVIEPGETYRLNDTTLLTEPGTYYDTLYYTNGRDSVYITIYLDVQQLDVKGTFLIDTVCGDDNALAMAFIREQGHPIKYDLMFSDMAKGQGFEDRTAQPMADTAVVEWAVTMPKDADNPQRYVRPDRYSVTLRVTDKQNRQTTYDAAFTVLYPSWVILQRWNDVLTITNRDFNGGYNFTHVQWYRDGEKVESKGNGDFYYYAGDGEQLQMGVPYRADLTRTDDGKTFSTCDYIPSYQEEKVIFKEEFAMAPRYAGNSRQVTVRTTLSGRYIVYDVSGKQVLSGLFGAAYGSPDIIFPDLCPNGTYLIRFMPDNGKEKHKKWMVY
ncbi:MAG: hypothetical protein J6Y00_02205 [Paludibacteraceae bacterium]|nr:hypothetical protein [Paludibacteraceae bacterium]